MERYPKAPVLPGTGNPRNLVSQEGGFDACPCCGAVWKGGRPWSDKVLSPVEMGEKAGLSPQAITTRIRTGAIAAYPAAGTGARNKYLIPIFEMERVLAQEPFEGGPRPEKVRPVEDLGVKRG